MEQGGKRFSSASKALKFVRMYKKYYSVEDLKKLEDEINTLKQVKNSAGQVKIVVGFGLKRAASSRAEKEARNHANAAASIKIGRFWKVGNVCKSSRNVCRSVSRPI